MYINFIDWRKAQRQRKKNLLIVFFIVLIALINWVTYQVNVHLKQQKLRYSTLSNQQQTLLEQYEIQQSQYQTNQLTLKKAEEMRYRQQLAIQLLIQMKQLINSQLQLVAMNLKQSSFNIKGIAQNSSIITNLLFKLDQLTVFKSVKLKQLKKDQQQKNSPFTNDTFLFVFEINATLNEHHTTKQ